MESHFCFGWTEQKRIQNVLPKKMNIFQGLGVGRAGSLNRLCASPGKQPSLGAKSPFLMEAGEEHRVSRLRLWRVDRPQWESLSPPKSYVYMKWAWWWKVLELEGVLTAYYHDRHWTSHQSQWEKGNNGRFQTIDLLKNNYLWGWFYRNLNLWWFQAGFTGLHWENWLILLWSWWSLVAWVPPWTKKVIKNQEKDEQHWLFDLMLPSCFFLQNFFSQIISCPHQVLLSCDWQKLHIIRYYNVLFKRCIRWWYNICIHYKMVSTNQHMHGLT